MTQQIATTQRSLAQALEKRFAHYAGRRGDIGLVLTEQCPVGCRHCLASCTMEVSDLPPLETHLAWIAKVSQVDGCQSICITGGEPFVHFHRLLRVVDGCRNHGLRATVVTSAYWATSDEMAALWLQALADAGLTGISVSSDVYHQERIPLANVARVLRASKERGITSGITLSYTPRGRGPTQLERDLRRDLGRHIMDGVQVRVGSIVKAGRARELAYSEALPAEQPKLVCNAVGPLIRQDGTVVCCCGAALPDGSPLVIGDLNSESFDAIYQRFRGHPIVPFIQAWGLVEMLDRLSDEGLAGGLEGYGNAREEEICQLCQAMLSDRARISFFAELLQDAEVRKQVGLLHLVLYGDPALLKAPDR